MANEVTAKVMGDLLAKGMSLSEVDLSKTVNSEALTILERIKNILSGDAVSVQKLEKVQEIINQYAAD